MATILVVDDRAPDRELLSTLLSHGHHRVLEAADGAEALRLLRADHPDLVISDVLLPKMDGYELVRQMHLDPSISETTVIFYTAAFNEQEARDLARECGVTLILSKPTDPKIILDKVTEVLNSKGAKGVTSLPAAFEEKHQELLIDKLMRQVEELQRSEESLQGKTQILTGINRVFYEALTCDTEEELARTCLDVAKGLTGSRVALMGKVNRARKLDIVLSDSGWSACRLPGSANQELPDGLPHIHDFLKKIIIQGRSLIANDLGAHADKVAVPPDCPPLTAFLGAPLRYAGKAIGLIALGKITGSYDSADQEAVENLSFAIVEAFLRQRAEAALKQAHAELEQRVEERTAELNTANKQLNNEIEVRHRVEEALRFSHYFLEIANRHIEVPELLREFAAEVKKFAQCSAVGIRLLDESGNIPYQVSEGFPQEFLDQESPLSIKSDQCMCINVIKGSTNPRLPCHTPKGSFYLNGTTRFIATVSEEEKGKTRNICNLFGYESVALVPIRAGNKVIGLIHLADPKENKVQLEKVVLVERIALQLGAALQRILSQQELMQLRRSFASRLLDAQERERKRISYELHDELGQSLTALKMQLRGVERNLTVGWMKEELGHSLDYLNEVVDNVRRLSQDLRPSLLEHMGIAAALRHLFHEFAKCNQIPVTLDVDSIEGFFSAEAEVNIYRIFQESFTNIAKHAQADLVTVSIKRQDGKVNFRVEDNGRGFDAQQMLNGDITKRGLGFLAMAERMRILNGCLEIWSQEGQGTRISFAVPVNGS